MNIEEMTVGQRFKHFRIQKGLSQNELCDGICSYSTISQLENDRKIPAAKTLGKLAERLNVSLREIMGEQEREMDTNFQIEIVRVYIEKGDYDDSLRLIDELERTVDLLEHQKVELLIGRANCLNKVKRHQEAVNLLLPFLEQQQRQQTIDDELLCDTYNKLGEARYRLNDFEKAYSAFEQGYRISLKLPEIGLVAARVTKNLGLTCNQLGFLSDARRFLQKAYEYYERASDIKGIANTLFDLAVATGDMSHLKSARSMYESLNMAVEANLAKLHYAYFVESKSDLQTAFSNVNASILAFDQMGEHGLALYTRSKAAMLCIERANDLDVANDYLSLAEKTLEVMTDQNEYVCSYFYKARARFHFEVNNFNQSIEDSQTASEMYDRMGLYSESADALLISAEVYAHQGLHESAYNVARRVNELLRKNSQGGLM